MDDIIQADDNADVPVNDSDVSEFDGDASDALSGSDSCLGAMESVLIPSQEAIPEFWIGCKVIFQRSRWPEWGLPQVL